MYNSLLIAYINSWECLYMKHIFNKSTKSLKWNGFFFQCRLRIDLFIKASSMSLGTSQRGERWSSDIVFLILSV